MPRIAADSHQYEEPNSDHGEDKLCEVPVFDATACVGLHTAPFLNPLVYMPGNPKETNESAQ